MLLAMIPRIRYQSYRLPLQEMSSFSKKLDGPRMLLKRDDGRGLALESNKSRKLEFLMADARVKGADTAITIL